MTVVPLTSSTALAMSAPQLGTTTSSPFSSSSTSNTSDNPTTFSETQLQNITNTSTNDTVSLMDFIRGTKANQEDGNKGKDWLEAAKNGTGTGVGLRRHSRSIVSNTKYYGCWTITDGMVGGVSPFIKGPNGEIIRQAGWDKSWNGCAELRGPEGSVFGIDVLYYYVYKYDVFRCLVSKFKVGYWGPYDVNCEQS